MGGSSGSGLPSDRATASPLDVTVLVVRAAVSTSERVERPVGLRPHIEHAFEQSQVSIDFAGFSGETLHGAIQEPLDKIRIGRLSPEEINIRVLIPDLAVPTGLPSLAGSGDDDPGVRGRSDQIARRFNQAITESVQELADLKLVKTASVRVRVYRATPLFKLYIINGDQAFYGFYPVLEHMVTVGDKPTGGYDAMGKDAILFHFDANDDQTSVGAQYVQQAQLWFDSVWNSIARDFVP